MQVNSHMDTVSRRLVRALLSGIALTGAATSVIAETGFAAPEAAYPRDQMEARAGTHAYVARGFGMAPKGRFLLIRNKEKMCAVRFTDFRRGRGAKPGTTFNAGDQSFYARYEWYFQADGTGDFSRGKVLTGTGNSSAVVLVDIGHVVLHPSKDHVRCGDMLLKWHYPAAVSIREGSKPADQGFEMAPTRWSRIEEVKATDQKLKWYRFEGPGNGIFISIDEL